MTIRKVKSRDYCSHSVLYIVRESDGAMMWMLMYVVGEMARDC